MRVNMKNSFTTPTISAAIAFDDRAVPDRDDAATSECPDLHSATVSYARRFEGSAGRWMLAVQADVLARLMAPWRGARVLDTGGGHGQAGAALAPLGHRIVLHATSSDAAGLGRTHAAEVVYGPLDRAPVADRSVDVAVALRMMPHVEDWRALVALLPDVRRKKLLEPARLHRMEIDGYCGILGQAGNSQQEFEAAW